MTTAITRRSLLGGGIASGAALPASPNLARAQGTAGGAGGRTLRFVPSSDLATLDPIVTTASMTTVHAMLVYDTLYGLDEGLRPHPQMVAGHAVEDGGLTWTMILRDGLRFHDGEPVLARDAVASIRRWGERDMYGQEVLSRSDEIAALDDRRIRFRLKRPFPVLPDALGKHGPSLCVIMPERFARLPSTQQVTEAIGSGPYRFVANERLAGARVVYRRFDGYVPRPDGLASRLAGPKVAHFERIEWNVISDPGTMASALATGEVDYVEVINSDVVPMLRRSRDVQWAYRKDPGASILRFNWLQPPFDKPAIRRALLGAVNQEDFMTAAYGGDRDAWRTGAGTFTSDSPMASGAGLEALTGPRDLAKVRRDLAAAGYAGERVVLLQAADLPTQSALAEVAADMLRRAGINLDVQAADWGTVAARRSNRGPLNQGGWSIFVTNLTNSTDPGGHLGLRANGANAWFGWPDSPRLEALRQEWFDAAGLTERQRICAAMQVQALQDVAYIPLGESRPLLAHRRGLTGIGPGLPTFHGLRWS